MQHFRDYPASLSPIVMKLFQKSTPMLNALTKAFTHRDGSNTCEKCKEAGESLFCEEGFIYYDKNHHSYSSLCVGKCKKLEPQRMLRKVAQDLFDGIEHTEKFGFHDQNFKAKISQWRSGYGPYMEKREEKFKKTWERKMRRIKMEEMEAEMNKAASGSDMEPPLKIRRKKNQNRNVSQDDSDSDSDSSEGEDSDDVTTYSIHDSDSDSR